MTNCNENEHWKIDRDYMTNCNENEHWKIDHIIKGTAMQIEKAVINDIDKW